MRKVNGRYGIPRIRVFKYVRFIMTLLKFRINREMMYSFNFWTAFMTDLSIFLLQIAMFSALFLQVETINGWNIYQMVVFIGTFTIIDALYMATYFFGVLSIPEKIRTGSLDIYLAKPVNTLFFISFENLDPGSALLVIPGILMVSYGVGKLGVTITVWRLLGYVFLLLLMYLLMYTLMVIIRSLAFRFVRIDSYCELENELVNFVFRIPGIVYRGLWKVLFFIFLPYGLIATIPAQFITSVLDSKYWVLSLGVAAIFWIICMAAWKRGLRQYSSASS